MTTSNRLGKMRLLLVAIPALALLAPLSAPSRAIHGGVDPHALSVAGGPERVLNKGQGQHQLEASNRRRHRTLSCNPPPLPPLEALEKADVAFFGTVSSWGMDRFWFRARFRVHRNWKGKVWPGIEVITPMLSTGVFFEVGERLIVFADEGPEGLFTETCDGTTSDVEAAIRQLPPSEAVFDHYLPGLVSGGIIDPTAISESQAQVVVPSGTR